MINQLYNTPIITFNYKDTTFTTITMANKIDSKIRSLKEVHTSDLLSRFKSKHDLYQYLTENVSQMIHV